MDALNHNIIPYLGGTLFEIFVAKKQFAAFKKLVDELNLSHVEVSDGCITMHHEEKCEYIRQLAQNKCVLSEVGSKDESYILAPYKWIEQMQAELQAGAWKVIGEAREAGNIGLFRGSGEVRQGLVEEILSQIPYEQILWETPKKPQQVWFIKLLGANVNLGNIPPEEVIPLETIRLGLRSDTFLYGTSRTIQ